jgi:hypothetical protein
MYLSAYGESVAELKLVFPVLGTVAKHCAVRSGECRSCFSLMVQYVKIENSRKGMCEVK